MIIYAISMIIAIIGGWKCANLLSIDIEDKMEMNTDAFFFGAPSDTYNADTIILNAII